MKNFIDDIYFILTKSITLSEILLNISFLLILGIISYIFYWDIINKQVFKSSKCKNNVNLINSEGSYYYVNVKDTNNNYLYDIKYDKTTKEASIDCKCTPGNYINNFKNIKVFNKNGNNGQKNINKNKPCNCDKNYIIDPLTNNNIYYSGNQFLVDYMENNNNLSSDQSYFIDTNNNNSIFPMKI